MRTWSEATNQYYEPDECVFFRNALQSGMYFDNGAKFQDILFDKKTKKLIFAFLKTDHERLKVLWLNHELE